MYADGSALEIAIYFDPEARRVLFAVRVISTSNSSEDSAPFPALFHSTS